MIGIICALRAEAERLIQLTENKTESRKASVNFTEGTLFGVHVVIAECGVGKVFAAICAEAMIIEYAPELIINSGVGGNFTKELKIGDIAVANALVQHDMDTSPFGDPVGMISGINVVNFECDKKAVTLLRSACDALGYINAVGTIATGDTFISAEAQKKRITDLFPATIACDMEGGAIAQTCYVNSVPFAAIRAISDDADGSSPVNFGAFLVSSAERSINVMHKFFELME